MQFSNIAMEEYLPHVKREYLVSRQIERVQGQTKIYVLDKGKKAKGTVRCPLHGHAFFAVTNNYVDKSLALPLDVDLVSAARQQCPVRMPT